MKLLSILGAAWMPTTATALAVQIRSSPSTPNSQQSSPSNPLSFTVVPHNSFTQYLPLACPSMFTPTDTLSLSINSFLLKRRGPISIVATTILPIIIAAGINSAEKTDCLSHSQEVIYFTPTYLNDTLALDAHNRSGLYFIRTAWTLTYTKAVQRALFNGTPTEPCPQGHCSSSIVPGTSWPDPVVLSYLPDPEPLRDGWHGARCQYIDWIRTVHKTGVDLGDLGHFTPDMPVSPAVLDFVEERLRTTYPVLEITLICTCTVGLLGIVVLLPICVWYGLKAWWTLSWAIKEQEARVRERANSAVGGLWERLNKGWVWVVHRVSRREEQTEVEAPSPAINLEEYPLSRPPSYDNGTSWAEVFEQK